MSNEGWRRLAAALLALTGTVLIAAYVGEAIIARWSEPDQSLLYWYSPFLIFGLLALRSAVRLGRRRPAK